MPFDLNEDALQGILAEIEQELTPVLKAEKEKLAKAAEESAEASPEKSAEKSAPTPEASAPEASSGAPEASASAEGTPPSEETPGEHTPGAPGADASAPVAPEASSPALPSDPAALQAWISGLAPEQQKALYLAAKQSLFAAMAPPAPAAPEATAPVAAPPAAPPASPPVDASAPPAMKTEMKSSPGNGGDPVKSVHKSETEKNEVDEIKDLIKSQGEQIKLLSKALDLMTKTPVRKAVTGISQIQHIKKSETEAPQLSKAELKEKMMEKVRDQSLTKKDRAAINQFVSGGYQEVSLVKHLLD